MSGQPAGHPTAPGAHLTWLPSELRRRTRVSLHHHRTAWTYHHSGGNCQGELYPEGTPWCAIFTWPSYEKTCPNRSWNIEKTCPNLPYPAQIKEKCSNFTCIAKVNTTCPNLLCPSQINTICPSVLCPPRMPCMIYYVHWRDNTCPISPCLAQFDDTCPAHNNLPSPEISMRHILTRHVHHRSRTWTWKPSVTSSQCGTARHHVTSRWPSWPALWRTTPASSCPPETNFTSTSGPRLETPGEDLISSTQRVSSYPWNLLH